MPGQGFNGFPGARQPQPQFAGAAQGQRRPTAGGYVPPRLNAPPPRLARGQGEDRPAPKPAPDWKPTPAPASTTSVVARVKLPSPDDLNVTAPTPAEDWTAALARLERLGVNDFRAQQVQGGQWKFVCKLPTATPGRDHRIESGPATTKAAAIRLALVEAERLARR